MYGIKVIATKKGMTPMALDSTMTIREIGFLANTI
jgi:hypothetical protein